jgi:hypothetical protein
MAVRTETPWYPKSRERRATVLSESLIATLRDVGGGEYPPTPGSAIRKLARKESHTVCTLNANNLSGVRIKPSHVRPLEAIAMDTGEGEIFKFSFCPHVVWQ